MKSQRSDYGHALYITPKHLTKTIKEITAKTSCELIDEMVITEAKILLNDLSMSVSINFIIYYTPETRLNTVFLFLKKLHLNLRKILVCHICQRRSPGTS